MTETLGLYFDPWRKHERTPPGRGLLARLVAKYSRAVMFKANPRDAAYMRALFAERYADGRFVAVEDDDGWRGQLAGAKTVVLLYGDAIGIGFGPLEAAVRPALAPGTGLRALNGRRRDFALTPSVLRGLRLRRVIERAMLGEWLAVAAFLIATPPLLIFDLARGRR